MRLITTGSRTLLGITISLVMLSGLILIALFSLASTTLAQGDTTAPAPTGSPYLNVLTQMAVIRLTGTPAVSPTPAVAAPTSTEVAPAAPALSADDAAATITALQQENEALRDKLAAAQTDTGATLYALVIVVIGLLLAFAVFFGLKRS